VKRELIIGSVMVAFLGAIILFSTVMAQGPDQKVPDTVTMHSKVWDTAVNVVGEHEVHGKQYQDFTFNHKKHNVDYKVACTNCHHKYEGKKNVWKEGDPVKKCDGCHNIVDLTKKTDPMSLYAAFHNNCVGCHKEHMKEWKATGKAAGKPKPDIPVGCTKCHKKKPAAH